MHLLLVRHGETVDNVGGRFAGHTDSSLTNHGVQQARRLGAYLDAQGHSVAHIFASDLQRAVLTAEAILCAQPESRRPGEVVKLEILREKNFGSFEGKSYHDRVRNTNLRSREVFQPSHSAACVESFREEESKASMQSRMDRFVDGYLHKVVTTVPDDKTVVVVAHGIILLHLWRRILSRFSPREVSLATDAAHAPNGLEYLGTWSNTGFWHLEMKKSSESARALSPSLFPAPVTKVEDCLASDARCVVTQRADENASEALDFAAPTFFAHMSLVIRSVNCTLHLDGFRKSGGGLGNVKHDASQTNLESFFQKRGRFG